MWKKFRDSTSGLNVNFLSGLFRRRSYSKFGSDNEINALQDLRDEENNKVSWTRRIHSKRRVDDENDNIFTEDGFQKTELCTTLRPVRDNRYSYQRDFASSSYDARDIHDDDMTSYGYGHDLSDDRKITSYEFYAGQKNGASPGFVKDEFQDFVNGYTQRRYQKLEDSDDMSDNVEYDVDSDYHSERGSRERGSRDSENIVFHSIKDVEPKWQEKPKKSKKRKKSEVALKVPAHKTTMQQAVKRARRVVRTSWKWFKRGFVGYSRQFATATNFFNFSVNAERYRS